MTTWKQEMLAHLKMHNYSHSKVKGPIMYYKSQSWQHTHFRIVVELQLMPSSSDFVGQLVNSGYKRQSTQGCGWSNTRAHKHWHQQSSSSYIYIQCILYTCKSRAHQHWHQQSISSHTHAKVKSTPKTPLWWQTHRVRHQKCLSKSIYRTETGINQKCCQKTGKNTLANACWVV